jgi:hypothetical protein
MYTWRKGTLSLFLSPQPLAFLVAGSCRCDRRILSMPVHEVASEHDHARDPKEQNLVGRDQQRCGIKHRLVARLIRPAERRERQQSGGEPGVQHVRDLLRLRSAAFRTTGWRRARNDHFLARAARPRRNAMSPPQLPRDAPVVNVVHPVQINRAVVLRDDRDFVCLDRLARAIGERFDLHEPLF